jgi:hypothetical protein
MTNETYVKQSLELNLFFLRIMKEHSLFLAVSFPPKDQDFIREASEFNSNFNNLLKTAVELASGVIDMRDDAVTEYTLDAEEKTYHLTGFRIDTALTQAELKVPRPGVNFEPILIEKVNNLNNRALSATKNLIRYKTNVLNSMLSCDLFSLNYPLLIEHIRREAILFVDLLTKLQNRMEAENLYKKALEEEFFWNQIMEEHSEFIRGYLDPTEEDLMEIANSFAIRYNELNRKIEGLRMNQFSTLLSESQRLTKEIKNFKTQGTQGLIGCKIRSIMVPLLGDHVLREANHYLHLLERMKKAR